MTATLTNQNITEQAEELFKIVMDLYSTAFDQLEALMASVPDSRMDLMKELQNQLNELQQAMDHDIALFDQAIHSDLEDLHQIRDRLKINEIYKQLKS